MSGYTCFLAYCVGWFVYLYAVYGADSGAKDECQFPSLEYPDELNMLIGKELLFKVEVKEDRAFKWDDSFKVKKVCSDEDIIREFKEESSLKTPEKSMFKTSLSELPDEESAADTGGNCSVVIDLSDVCTGGELTPISGGGSSNVARCLAPQKRKAAPRGERAAMSKKKGPGRPVKIEKE